MILLWLILIVSVHPLSDFLLHFAYFISNTCSLVVICKERAVLLAFRTCCFLIVCVFIPLFCVFVRMWNSIVWVPVHCLFSSPEPLGSQGELIVYPCSGVRCRRCRCRCRGRCRCRRRQQCLNIFSSETAWPIKAKLYVEPPWEGRTKVDINGPGHMAKMAAMPIYGKNL